MISNIYITNPDFDTTGTRDSPTHTRFSGSSSVPSNIEITNITIDRVYGGASLSILESRPRGTGNLKMKNITMKNVDGVIPIFKITEGKYIEISDLKFINCTVFNSQIASIVAIENFIVNSMIFQNLTLTGTFSGDALVLSGTENTVFDVNDLQLDGVKVENARSILFLDSETSITVNMNRFSVNNTEINNGIAVLMLGKVTTANIDGSIFRNVFPGIATDTSNYLISLEEITTSGNSSITFSGLDVQDCKTNLLVIGNSKQAGIENQTVTIKNSVIKNLDYEFFGDLIATQNIQATVPYKIVFEFVTFENIQFQRGGNLMKLGHQQDDFLEINH